MTLWSDLFNSKHLLSRGFYGASDSGTLTMPPRAAFIRASMVGAGGWDSSAASGIGGAAGFAAAFARVKTTCAPGEQFVLSVGTILATHDAGSSGGDSTLTRVIGSVVICRAARGTATAAGNASNCIGDTKRSGTQSLSGGDLADTFSLGFGGRSAQPFLAAAPGGGGTKNRQVYRSPDATYLLYMTFPPGNGRACIEVFDQDPTIVWPGYGG
jgi:hypothetical protein